MQEGALALVQMTKLAAAVSRLRDAGGLYVVYLMDPTTGGVLASWGSLGTVTWAMPGALVGFGGPRVVELMTGAPLAREVQSGERLRERGLVDDVVAPGDLRARIAALVSVTARPRPSPSAGEPPVPREPPRAGD